jgi:hypothetical protein
MKTKPDQLTRELTALLDRHAPSMQTGGRRVSHTPETLAKALHIDPREVPALLATGALDVRPVRKNDPTGPLSFDSTQLEEVRRRLLAEIVQQVIDADETGDPKAITLAAQIALAAYKKNAAKAATEFAARDEEHRPGWGSRLAKGAALAGAAYGGLAYMRGRQAGASGFLGRFRAGNAANVADIRKAGSAVSGLLRRGAARLAGKSLAVAPRNFAAADLTPARARYLLRTFGRELRRAGRA